MKLSNLIFPVLMTASVFNITAQAQTLEDPTPPIPNFLLNRVYYPIGYDFLTSKPIVLNSLDSTIVEPCINPRSGDKEGKLKECNTKLVEPSAALRQAIAATKTPILGKISKDGKILKARFIVTVTALYEGSYCTTHYAAGEQRDECISLSRICRDALKAPVEVLEYLNEDCKIFRFWTYDDK